MQSGTLLTIVAFLNADSDDPPLIFVFWYSLIGFALVAVSILWHLRYGRKWRQFRAQDWHQISGKFDDGDIVTMRKGRAGPISGYQVWLGYDYEAEGEQVGLYTLPFYGEFPNKEVAEQCRMKIANRAVIVRVSPRNPKRSCVLDRTFRLILVTNNSQLAKNRILTNNQVVSEIAGFRHVSGSLLR